MSARRRIRCAGIGLAATFLIGAVNTPVAGASHTQEALFQDGGQLLTDPPGTVTMLKGLGVDRVRLFMPWQDMAPRPRSHRRPRGFRAVSPAAYSSRNWARFDAVVRQAHAAGIGIDLDLGGGAPLWATAPGAPKHSAQSNWEPRSSEFGAFVHAVSQRYSGDYNPKTRALSPGDPADLPAVDFWSIWNEPNYGPSLAPQGAPGNVKVERSPWTYRNLLDAAWRALRQTGHGRDTILFGEVAPRGYPNPERPHLGFGIFNGMKPLVFLRALYCVDSRYRPLRGGAAAVRGCPTTAAGSRRFRAAHSALFNASGFADHPYSRWYPPNSEPRNDPDYSSLADMGRLQRALDRLNRVYGSRTRFPIWNTEYGYITSPPKRSPDPKNKVPYINQSTAAYYLNWAEYISWRDPRLRSMAQYLLSDPLPATARNDFGGFASGLLRFNGSPKPTFYAYRLPLYLPKTSARRGHSLEVWGCARPSQFSTPATSATQTVTIELRSGSGPFKPVETIPITTPRGYFDTHVVFPSSGMVRLMWSYPPLDPLSSATRAYSRLVRVTVR